MNLSDEVLKKMIEVAPDYFKPILTLAIATGMRKNEILKLRWQDVDLRLGTIRVRAELAKSKKERIIPISGELVAMLDSLPRKDEYVFYGPGGGPIKDIRGVFRSVLKAVGLKSGQRNGLTFHDLRHVAAFRLVKLADIETVKRILGHSTLLVTSRYLHPTDLDKRLAIERSVESLFSGRQKDVNRKIRASGQEIGLIDKFNNSN